MICPHCKKLIQRKVPKSAFTKAKILRGKGYSFRDISDVLKEEKIYVSFATLSRYFRKVEKVENE